MEQTDVLIVGAGHNGLVSAILLARAGLKVRVLEVDKDARRVSLSLRRVNEVPAPPPAPPTEKELKAAAAAAAKKKNRPPLKGGLDWGW